MIILANQDKGYVPLNLFALVGLCGNALPVASKPASGSILGAGAQRKFSFI
jgi:hypothetical protein